MRQRKSCPKPLLIPDRNPWLEPLQEGSSVTTEEDSTVLPRFKLLSVDDLSPTKADTTDRPELLWVVSNTTEEDSTVSGKIVSEGSTIAHEYGSDEEDMSDPFLYDEFGNLTDCRVSDLNNNRYSDACYTGPPQTTEKKQSRAERLMWHNKMMEEYMKASLKKYNSEENLDGDLCFEFVKCVKESFIAEGLEWYTHFNFEAVQSGSSSLFFAEVIIDPPDCEVTCCMILREDDNGRCLGCHNQGDPDLKHPSHDSLYVGGHVDCPCPFLIDTESDSE